MGIYDGTEMTGFIIDLYRQYISLKIETQVILQILVKKGICTPEEVQQQRIIVGCQPKYANMIKDIIEIEEKFNEEKKFEDLLKKSLSGGSGSKVSENLTEEERNYLLSKLRGGF